jgi:hypothetical protein
LLNFGDLQRFSEQCSPVSLPLKQCGGGGWIRTLRTGVSPTTA